MFATVDSQCLEYLGYITLSVVQTRILTMRKARSPRRVLTGINLKGFKAKARQYTYTLEKIRPAKEVFITGTKAALEKSPTF